MLGWLFNIEIYNMRDYTKCDELKESLMTLKDKRRKLQCELKRIEKSNYQSCWYYKKKGTTSDHAPSLRRSRSSTPEKSRSSTPMPPSSPSEPFSPRHSDLPPSLLQLLTQWGLHFLQYSLLMVLHHLPSLLAWQRTQHR